MSDLEKEQAVQDAQSPTEPASSGSGSEAEAAEQEALEAAILRENSKYTRRSFAVGMVAAAAGFGLYEWIGHSRENGMQPEPLRKAYRANAKISRAIFDDRAMAPTYPVDRAEELRVNGDWGLQDFLVLDSWRLQLVGVADANRYPQYVSDVTAWEYEYAPVQANEDRGHDTKGPPAAGTAEKMASKSMIPIQERLRREPAGKTFRGRGEAGQSKSMLSPGTPGLLLTMDDIVKLPKHDMVTQFKCIEGWSQIVHWGGVRFADLIAAYPPAKNADGSMPRYVYMETPDGNYYVGYDLNVCMHPQSLLVTTMGGKPLTQPHGAPLRLHTPAKYGYKQIKRIGLIEYTNQRPDDYWTKLGYDWYAGL